MMWHCHWSKATGLHVFLNDKCWKHDSLFVAGVRLPNIVYKSVLFQNHFIYKAKCSVETDQFDCII